MTNAEIHVSGFVYSVPQFNESQDWNSYERMLKQYFLDNNIDNRGMVTILLSVIGTKLYKIIKDQSNPILPEYKQYNELCNLLRVHFAPAISEFRKRVEFYNLQQEEGQTCNNWFKTIQRSAIQCKFGTRLNDVLKDKFVSGLRPGEVLDRICMVDPYTYPLKTVVKLVLKYEETMKNTTIDVHKLCSYNKFGKEVKKTERNTKVWHEWEGKTSETISRRKSCSVCGKNNHKYMDCWYKDSNCNLCDVKGHLAKVCKNKDNIM